MFQAIALFLLVMALITVLPFWPHAKDWGYRPAGFVVGAMIVVVLISEMALPW